MSISHEKFSRILNNVTPRSDQESQKEVTQNTSDLRLLSKKISQLIAKSWLPEGEEIRSVFLSNDTERISEMLLENGINLKNLGVGEYTKLEVRWDSFFGSFEDLNDPPFIFRFILAYPPRPSEFNLSDSDLQEWVADADDDHKTPSHPYIPATW